MKALHHIGTALFHDFLSRTHYLRRCRRGEVIIYTGSARRRQEEDCRRAAEEKLSWGGRDEVREKGDRTSQFYSGRSLCRCKTRAPLSPPCSFPTQFSLSYRTPPLLLKREPIVPCPAGKKTYFLYGISSESVILSLPSAHVAVPSGEAKWTTVFKQVAPDQNIPTFLSSPLNQRNESLQ